jgi:dienelactone hydrolase
VRPTLALAIVLVATACGGSPDQEGAALAGPRLVASTQTASVLARQFGEDADGFYLYTPRRKAWDSIVVFLHGNGGPGEITPMYHRAWLEHLAERGSAVVYPRFEQRPGGSDATGHIDAAVRSALILLGRRAPIVGIGYSRGGRLVADWAAVTEPSTKPRAIISVFPANTEDPIPDYSQLAPATRVLVLTGDRDDVVGQYGAAFLLHALERSGFDLHNVRLQVLKSTSGFVVDHVSPFDTSARARSLFWKPADRLIAQVG